MTSRHMFDHYLSHAKGNPAEQKKALGNASLEQAKTAADEWKSDLEHLAPASADLAALPEGSWLLKFAFRLSSPFTSKSEAEFHHYEGQHEVQNPIVRDYLTGLSMVRPTTWKGHLRFAARMTLSVMDKAQEPETMRRLFGETRGEEGGMEGRLRFFPTFFTGNVQREVITPLKRDTRTPTRGPIDIEVAPAGAEGTFCLLYLPLPRGKDWSLVQIAEDLQAIAGALRAMFLEYGFSAKKTAGWGLVEDSLPVGQQGFFWAKGEMWPQARKSGGDTSAAFQEPFPEWLPLMDAAGNPLPQLVKQDGGFLSNSEYGNLAQKHASSNVYRRFRSWYETHGEEWRRRQSTVAQVSAMREHSFASITDMEALLKGLVGGIASGGCP